MFGPSQSAITTKTNVTNALQPKQTETKLELFFLTTPTTDFPRFIEYPSTNDVIACQARNELRCRFARFLCN